MIPVVLVGFYFVPNTRWAPNCWEKTPPSGGRETVDEKTPPSSRERDRAQLKRAKMLMKEGEPPFDPLG